VEELCELAGRDAPFYAASSGGVTLGGGDPLLQNEAAVALLALCRERGLNTAIETAGNYPWEYLENTVPLCDTIHFDLKAWDSDTALSVSGASNARPLENLLRLDNLIASLEYKPALVVRLPLLPDYNFTLDDMDELGGFLSGLRFVSRVDILPFHNLGEPKYAQLGKPYKFLGSLNLHAEAVLGFKDALIGHGLPVHIAKT
jgi:pyruvate formate lyase activating enzyme